MDKIDPRYKRGKVYTIRCKYDDTLIYVGSTIQTLSNRMAGHRKKGTQCSLYKYINSINDDWDNWYIELYENYPCNNKPILDKREGEVTRLIGNINMNIAGRTKKQHYQENRDKLIETQKQHYQNNRDKILERTKQYQQNNRDKIAKRKKQNYQENREKILERSREKIKCDNCGIELTSGSLTRHKKSQKCLNYNINNN